MWEFLTTEDLGFVVWFFFLCQEIIRLQELAGYSIHSYMCLNRGAQLQVKQQLLALLVFKTSS